jgi:uncharacterized protein (DUF2132 family)
MSARIPIRCFLFNPSVKSSLTFLRKTPWARKKVEMWFVEAIADRSSWEDSGEPGKAPSSSSDTGEPATKREPRVVLRKKPNP